MLSSLAKPQIQEARLTRINQSASAKIVNQIAHLWMLDSFLFRCFQFFSMNKKQWLKHLLRHDLAIVTNLTCSVYRCHQRALRSLRFLVIRLRNLITRVLTFQNHVKLTQSPAYGYYQFVNNLFIYLFSQLLVNQSVSFNLDCLSSLTCVKVSSLVPGLPTGNSAGRPCNTSALLQRKWW